MLKKYNQLFLSALIISDSLVILSSWIGAYYLRFHSGWIPLYNGIPPVEQYQVLLLPVLILFLFNFKVVGLYQPLRGKSLWVDYYNIIKANTISVLILSALLFFYREDSYSRMTVGIFWLTATFSLVASHMLVRNVLKMLRLRGKNLRYVLIAGAGELGQEVAERIDLHPEMGFKIVGFLTTQEDKVGTLIDGYPVLGLLDDVSEHIREHEVDKLFITLPMKSQDHFERVLFNLGEESVDIKVVPDLLQYMSLSGGIDNFDGLPIVNLTESPLYGWNLLFKRSTDIVISFFAKPEPHLYPLKRFIRILFFQKPFDFFQIFKPIYTHRYFLSNFYLNRISMLKNSKLLQFLQLLDGGGIHFGQFQQERPGIGVKPNMFENPGHPLFFDFRNIFRKSILPFVTVKGNR